MDTRRPTLQCTGPALTAAQAGDFERYVLHRMKIITILIPVLLAGCAGLEEFSSHLTKSHAEAVAELARNKAFESGVVKETQEIEILKNTKPHMSYYFLAKPYADYSIRWQVNSVESILVYGRGNILLLEGARVERRNSASVKPST